MAFLGYGAANPDPAALEDAISKLKGRSNAQSLLRQLNTPYVPLTADVVQSMETLGQPRAYQNRSLVPSPGSQVVPYQPGGAVVPFQGSGAIDVASRQVGQRALPAAGGGGIGALPPGGGLGPAGAPFGPPIPGGIPSSTSGAVPSASRGVGALASAGGNAGRYGAIASRFLQNPNATGAARFINPSMLNAGGKLSLRAVGGRALGYGGLGIAGAQVLNAAIPGDPAYQRTLSNAAVGAGVGATVGSVVPGIGTAVGALAGGTAGALSSLFGNDSGPKTNKQVIKFNEQLTKADIPPEMKAQISSTYNTLYSLAESDEEKDAAFQAAKQQLVSALGADMQMQQDADIQLASQAMLQQFLKPQVQGIQQTAINQRSLLDQVSSGLPAELRAPARAGAGQRVADASRVAAAYAQQMGSIPQLAALQTEQARKNQAFQQYEAQGAGGGQDLQALLTGG